MIIHYCNQTITLKTKISTNEYNEATFTSSTIKARFQYDRKLVRNSTGETVVSEAMMFTESKVVPDDIITYDSIDWVVKSVQNIVGLDGNLEFYEVRL